jgi:hypothetical protein
MSKLYYTSGEEIRIGDVVNFSGSIGKIFFIIQANQYSENYTESNWCYLKHGFGVETKKYGLVHQPIKIS